MSNNPNKDNGQERKTVLNLVLSLALLFFAVILAVNGVKKSMDTAIVSAVVGFSGTLLFGSVGVCLLVGEIRFLLDRRK